MNEERVRVEASRPYDVVIGRGILPKLEAELKKSLPPCKIMIAVDDNVEPLYFRTVESVLSSSGYKTQKFVLENGEKSKNLALAEKMLEALAKGGFMRSDAVLSLGGGVTGDLSGFVASVYMRGINLVALPTTLLSQIDSSIGGKTAINFSNVKNLVGSFYQPKLVFIETSFLDTLPTREKRCGLGELAKYGVIDEDMFSLLSKEKFDMKEAIKKAVEIKAKIVASDERDEGARAVLNLGHTIAHAVEANSDFAISHGEAVAVGISIISKSCLKNGILEKDEYDKISKMLDNLKLNQDFDVDLSKLLPHIYRDKKNEGDKIGLVLIYGIGKVKKKLFAKKEAEEFFLK